jgi:hypothetical protein
MKHQTPDAERETTSVPNQQPDTARTTGSTNEHGTVASLHETVGNQAVQQLHERGALQAKLEVSQPGDREEREAERVAEAVLQGDESTRDGRAPTVTRRSGDGTNENGTLDSETEAEVRSVTSGGRPLPAPTRSFFESRFGRDFSDVRVHTGSEADDAARSIDAEAFTFGSDVVFRRSRYDLHSSEGQEVIAHELTHVIQQGLGARSPDPAIKPSQTVHRQQSSGTQGDKSGMGVAEGIKAGKGTDPELGYVNIGLHGIGQQLPVRILNEQEWKAQVQELDNVSYYNYVAGFLHVAANPEWVRRGRTGAGGEVKVKRAPTKSEILDFIRALYTTSGLDLSEQGIFKGMQVPGWNLGPMERGHLKENLSTLISRYQTDILSEFSHPKSPTAGGPPSAVGSLAAEGGERIRFSMIANAGASANRGVLMAAKAAQMKQAGKTPPTDMADQGYNLIRNAARTIYKTVKAHEAQMKYRRQVVDIAVGTVFNAFPGGAGPVSRALKSIAETATKEIARSVATHNRYTDQIKRIKKKFRQMVTKTESNTPWQGSQQARNAFESGIK